LRDGLRQSRRSLRLSLLLGGGLHERRTMLLELLLIGKPWRRLLSPMSAVPTAESRRLAARVWSARRVVELDAAMRFEQLATELAAQGASSNVTGLAREAAAEELRHAELCGMLSRHFGGLPASVESLPLRRLAPPELGPRDALAYEVVAVCCVTETLSTALLGGLVERATDPLARRSLQSILRDEVRHSRLGWAYLAETAPPTAMASVSRHLPALLAATLADELFDESTVAFGEAALAGLGQLERAERRRIVHETLERVVFPGLELFGADAEAGRRWLLQPFAYNHA
jgi:hypothetical protein